MDAVDSATAVAALRAQYEAVTATVQPLSDDELRRGTDCAGWTVRDVLFHLLLDAQRALVAYTSPASAEPDRDHVSYWQDWQRGSAEAEQAATAHARFVRLVAPAYSRQGLLAHWSGTSAAVARAAEACPHDAVETQGHVLTPADLTATLAVEATLHHLDLTKELPDAPAPADAALALTRRTLDGLLDSAAPEAWDDATYARKATGRLSLDDVDRAALDDAADRIPVFG